MSDRRDGEAYVLPEKLKLAVEIAYATGRPLLLRGDPGSGKSSLASHIAWLNSARYYELVVTSRTQAQDLLWSFDTVRRLADAQLNRHIDDHAYVEPGVLWWAFARSSALTRGGTGVEPALEPNAELNEQRSPSDVVVLIDEIDKADPDLPNGLLVPLGSGQFQVAETKTVVRVDDTETRHLIIVTTNEQRELPQAFLRRCVVVWLDHPDDEGLVAIARKHLESEEGGMTENDAELAWELAKAVVAVRKEKTREAVRAPSTAEFLDALRACRRLGITTSSEEWETLREMTLLKHKGPA